MKRKTIHLIGIVTKRVTLHKCCIKCKQMGHEVDIYKSKKISNKKKRAKVVDEEEEDQLFIATCFASNEESEN